MSYDSLYTDAADYFGAEPEKMLVDHVHLLDPSAPILDVGCGQGRNALYLAREGRRVLAIDPSRAAIEAVSRVAGDDNLPLEAHVCGFEECRVAAGSLAGVLLFGIIQILEWEKIGRLRDHASRWTRPGGVVFITAFSLEDPRYDVHARTGKRIGTNSYQLKGEDIAEGSVRTYLEPYEILSIFGDWDIIHHWEGMGPEHRHGTGPSERHGRIEAVLRKRK